MKVNELRAEQLDYWVAKAKGLEVFYPEGSDAPHYLPNPQVGPRTRAPSRFWSQAGPIIEEEKIDLNWEWEGLTEWTASLAPDINAQGSTVLEAAMRAYVTAKLGEEVTEQNG